MGAKDDRPFPRKVFDEFANLNHLPGIKTDRWFIQDKYVGVIEQSLSKANPLAKAFGKFPDQAISDFADSTGIHYLINLFFSFFPVNSFYTGSKPQIFRNRHVRIKGSLLREISGMALHFQRVFGHIVSIYQRSSPSWREKTRKDSHGGRLTRTIWPQQSHHLPFINSKGNILDAQDRAIIFCKIFYLDHSKLLMFRGYFA